jgi:hypothetical protein
MENAKELITSSYEKQEVDVPSKTAAISEMKTLISSIDND